ncbi:MAG: ComEC/Rec2 family competence protein [bacterium]
MILAGLFGFIGGIFIGSLFKVTAGLMLGCFVFCLILFVYKKSVPEDQKIFLGYVCIIFLGISLGICRMYFSDLNQTSQLQKFAGQKINVEGIVVDEPDVRENNTKLTIKLSKVFSTGATTTVSEKILVTTQMYPEYKYGDKLSLSLVLQEPKNIESDGRVFDYSGYLRVRGIWYTGGYAKIKLISSGHGSVIKDTLFKIKKSFTSALDLAIPQPESALMAGLLLGTKQSLGKDLLAEFSRAGVSHVVVLSGYNIAIVATSIMSVLRFLPNAFSFGIGCVSIILFTILSGGGASAWRAAIMVLVAFFAKKLNRDYTASRAFGFAVVLMLAPNPLLLVFDPSFQLSALATIGLIFVSPFIVPYMKWVTEKFGMREIVSSTVATQLTVLPFLIYNTGVLSVVSLPVNILILGTLPTTMFLGFITGIFGLISWYFSFIPAIISYVFLWYQLTVVHLGATLPLGAISLPAFSPAILILVYVIIGAGLYFLHKRKTT